MSADMDMEPNDCEVCGIDGGNDLFWCDVIAGAVCEDCDRILRDVYSRAWREGFHGECSLEDPSAAGLAPVEIHQRSAPTKKVTRYYPAVVEVPIPEDSRSQEPGAPSTPPDEAPPGLTRSNSGGEEAKMKVPPKVGSDRSDQKVEVTTPKRCSRYDCEESATHRHVIPTPFGTERGYFCAHHVYEEKQSYSRYSTVEEIRD